MIVCTDVQYNDANNTAQAAAVALTDWADSNPLRKWTAQITPIEPYVPGQFYRREMPCLLQLLTPHLSDITVIVIDGYVWLGGKDKPGLGAHLYEALERNIPVIGVAKTKFADASPVSELLRGSSQTPLYVSAAGMDLSLAMIYVAQMAGAFRLPDALKLVDRLSRSPT